MMTKSRKKEDNLDLQVQVIKWHERRFPGWIQRDIVPVFVDEQQQRTQRVYHHAALKIEYAVQKS